MFLHLSVILFKGEGHLADTPPGQRPPDRHPQQTLPLGRHPPADTPQQTPLSPQQTTTAADGTHHTGMHSCVRDGLHLGLLCSHDLESDWPYEY